MNTISNRKKRGRHRPGWDQVGIGDKNVPAKQPPAISSLPSRLLRMILSCSSWPAGVTRAIARSLRRALILTRRVVLSRARAPKRGAKLSGSSPISTSLVTPAWGEPASRRPKKSNCGKIAHRGSPAPPPPSSLPEATRRKVLLPEQPAGSRSGFGISYGVRSKKD
jgi:hypothetical protein